MIPVEFVVVVFQDALWLIFIIWRIWFLNTKLFCQFLMENFGDLVMSVSVSNLG
jgi:hypothetical protein